jgi:hypothetical protein
MARESNPEARQPMYGGLIFSACELLTSAVHEVHEDVIVRDFVFPYSAFEIAIGIADCRSSK